MKNKIVSIGKSLLNSIRQIGIFSFVLSLAFLTLVAVFSVRAWTAPATAPATPNADAPINAGGTGQIKAGPFGVNGAFNAYADATVGGNLVVSGTLGVSANVFTYSDENLKTNIKTLDNSLAKILKLRGVNFNWKEGNSEGEQVGLIAQEVEQIYPELVGNVNGIKAVQYSNLVAPLIEAVKAQQKQIENQQQQIDALRAACAK